MSSKITIPLVIFAGGKSSRMQTDKSLLPFGGYKTLTEYQLRRFENFFDNIYISCKDNTKFDFKANFVLDTNQDIFSPLIAIKSIFDILECKSFIALSVDTPFISIQTLLKLTKANNMEYVATTAFSDCIEPLCTIYNRTILATIDEAIKNDFHKLSSILKNAIKIECNKDEFINLNYQDDYQKALKQSII